MKPKSRRRAAGWNLTGGWCGTLVIMLQGLVLVPLYLSVLGERLYGFWLASGGILAWLAMVDVGGGALTAQRCAAAYGRKELQEVVDYFYHGVIVNLGVIIVYCLALIPVGSNYLGWLAIDAVYREQLLACFYIAGTGGALVLANNFLRGFSGAMQRVGVQVFAGLAGDIGALAFVIIGLTNGMGLYAVAWSAVVRPLVPLLANLVYVAGILRMLDARVSWQRRIFRDYVVTTPLILGAKASGNLVTQMPTIVLTKMLGPEAAVSYAVTIRAAQIIQQVATNVIGALTAPINHYLHDGDVVESRRSKLLTQITVGVVGGLAIGLVVYALCNRAFVGLWVGEAQFGGIILTALTGAWTLIMTLMRLEETLLSAGGGVQSSAVIGICERLLRAGLMIPSVGLLGVDGIPLSAILVGAASLGAYSWYLPRVVPSAHRVLRSLRAVGLIFAAGVCLAAVASSQYVARSWLEWSGQAAAALTIVLAVTVFVDAEFRELCRQAVRAAVVKLGVKRAVPSRPGT